MLAFGDWTKTSVLVTGASSGIGRETAIAFAAAGARVTLVARRREQLQEVAEVIRQSSGAALVASADVTKRAQVRAAFAAAGKRFGKIDLVINNAGVMIPGEVTELAEADLLAMFRVNVLGALAVMQEAVRVMRLRGEGGIVNVASLAGRRGISPLGGYCATKFGLVGLTEALRMELRGSGVHVGLVLPGVIETPMAHGDEDLAKIWPAALNMPPSWVVWAIFAVARFRLAELSVPPGAATLEELAALAPGLSDSVIHWGTQLARTVATSLRRT